MFIYLNCVYITITILIQNVKPTAVKFKAYMTTGRLIFFYVVKINNQLNTADTAWKIYPYGRGVPPRQSLLVSDIAREKLRQRRIVQVNAIIQMIDDTSLVDRLRFF